MHQEPIQSGLVLLARSRLMLRFFWCACVAVAFGEPGSAPSCPVQESYTEENLKVLIDHNCGKVSRAASEFEEVLTGAITYTLGSEKQQAAWLDRRGRASAKCKMALEALANFSTKLAEGSRTNADMVNLRVAATEASEAWGGILMRGQECCTMAYSPYCVSPRWSTFTHIAVFFLLAILFLIACHSFRSALPCRSGAPMKAEVAESISSNVPDADAGDIPTDPIDESEEDKPISGNFAKELDEGSVRLPNPSPRVMHHLNSCVDDMRLALNSNWLQCSPLRVLPQAEIFSKAASDIFSVFFDDFYFQHDSVVNQHEHLMSAWRSHCAMVADRFIGRHERVKEEHLLKDALGDMATDFLEAFWRWRAEFWKYDQEFADTHQVEHDRESLPTRRWESVVHLLRGLPCTAELEACELTSNMVDLIAYLLVWGEAGNLRFMPEFIYFLTELLLGAEDLSSYKEVLPRRHPQGGGANEKHFMEQIIRPIYNVIFEEWYERVDVEDQFPHKDKKCLHDGFEAFLPPDAANYDDWNELFCNPQRIAASLFLDDGTRLCALPHSRRFAALQRVDWKRSLAAKDTKTHREVHSFWGAFAATHRIWLLHSVMFLGGIMAISPNPYGGLNNLQMFALGRFSSLGLVVPAHALLRGLARWQVTGSAFRGDFFRSLLALGNSLQCIFFSLPLGTYSILHAVAPDIDSPDDTVVPSIILIFHVLVSIAGLSALLLIPDTTARPRIPTQVSIFHRAIRYTFWALVLACKFVLGLASLQAMFQVVDGLQITEPGLESPTGFGGIWRNIDSSKNFMLWLSLWTCSLVLYIADTQLFFVVGCTILGVVKVFAQRKFRFMQFVTEDAVSKIPERFSSKVLYYAHEIMHEKSKARCNSSPKEAGASKARNADSFSPCFPHVWDRIVEYLRYDDSIDDELLANFSFDSSIDGLVNSKSLARPLGMSRSAAKSQLCKEDCGCVVQPGLDTDTGKAYEYCCKRCSKEAGMHDAVCLGEQPQPRTQILTNTLSRAVVSNALVNGKSDGEVHLPSLFHEEAPCEIFFKHYFGVRDSHWPENLDAQWRLVALARGLSLPMPRPFKAPYFPGLTVLIPHYGETILMRKEELFPPQMDVNSDHVPLIDWVKHHWQEEFDAFTLRMKESHKGAGDVGRLPGNQWELYTTKQWSHLSTWTSMRMQTLWRTVAGMCLYHHALQCHYEVLDGKSRYANSLARPSIWDPSDCFTCLVSMQMYKYFNADQLKDTRRMFSEFPSCFKVAFIDSEDTSDHRGNIHKGQRRRYFSCLIDGKCTEEPDDSLRLIPKYRIELPGYPILGDGKGDNQNHAIPFMRGTLSQCIDANQGAYFEQMLLLPCVLGEFRSSFRGDGNSKKIIGFPEHITSDIGSVGDMSASAETAFGTILQRSYAQLGVRMHYGHPDIMDKQCMMQQGGVSKATKTINLSEDIFAGMDFTLRGEGRKIKHREYFNLCKGRDLGFNTVLGFFSKLSSGAGEQILTRQMFRLGESMHLPELLGFYYAHVGYYFNQLFVSWSMPLLLCNWLLVVVSDCESTFVAFQHCSPYPAAQVIATSLSVWFSWILMLSIIANSLPHFMEIWMERSLKTATRRMVLSMITGSPLFFIFQAKVIGTYVANEIRTGGATYVSTGRGLQVDRLPFIFIKRDGKKKEVSGLYLDYANIAFYDGALLLTFSILVVFAGAVEDAGTHKASLIWAFVPLVLTIASWLCAPFVFNTLQFKRRYVQKDIKHWFALFFEDSGRIWRDWYERTQLKPRRGPRAGLDLTLLLSCLFLLTWYATVSRKVQALASAFPETVSVDALHFLVLLPPIGGSLILSLVIVTCIWIRSRARCCQDDIPDERTDTRAVTYSVPLVLMAMCASGLSVAETWWILSPFFEVGWHKSLMAGFVLKFAVLSACLYLVEDLLRMRTFQEESLLRHFLQTWLYAYRLARDFITSLLILLVLLPFVILNSFNDALCPGFSFHQLLIYRDAGHIKRKPVRFSSFWRSRQIGKSEMSSRSAHTSECSLDTDDRIDLEIGAQACSPPATAMSPTQDLSTRSGLSGAQGRSMPITDTSSASWLTSPRRPEFMSPRRPELTRSSI